MSAVFSKYLEVFNAKQFKESVSEPASSNLYMTFGRSFSWSSESSPPQANTSIASFNEVWNNMIGAKKITGNDIRHVVPRFNWANNSVYYAYDDLVDSRTLKSSNNQFYVVTDDWNVYKCLANNNGANSTTKPISISTLSDFQTPDGYIWKYMYTITAEERLRFVTNDYIPVKSLIVDDGSLQWGVQNNATSGALHNIKISNAGSGYTANDIVIRIVGDGQDANAYAIRNVTSNSISSIVIDNKGFGYTFANVTVTSATGSGASLRAVISPPDGHGSDPLTELGGSNLIIHTQFKSDENGKFPVVNDFRQLALLEDPLIFGTSDVMANIAASQLTIVTLTGSSAEYIEDEFVYQGSSFVNSTFSGRVVEWDPSNNKIKLSNVLGTVGQELLIGVTSGGARFISSITNPDMEKYSGKLLYIDNISPITRTIDQTEDFKIILNF